MRNNNKSTLIIIVSVLLFAAFISVSFFNYRTSTFSIRKEIVNSSLPLLRENIYSDIQKMVTPPLNVSSVMASDSFLIEWALAGEKDSEPVQQYLREIRNKYGYFSTFLFQPRPVITTITTGS